MAFDLTCPAGHAFTVVEPPEIGSTSCPQCGQTVSVGPIATETCAWVPSPAKPGAAAAPASGQRIGRFVLLAKVGEGATGIVFRAYDPSLDREVALKIPRAGLLNDAEEVSEFLREGLAAGKLRHPHIVPVHDSGQADGYCYIASAFIDGQTLKSAIEKRGRFPAPEAAELVARLAKALHYAHGKGVVHRDVKPGNIMLDAAGEPQIMDFGLAHRVTGETLETIDGVLVGTPAYMSPEQASGNSRAVDARSDLWSVGVVLYELLTGQRPFGGTAGQWIAAIQNHEPASPRKLDRSIPRDLETICLKCLAKTPAQRYATCEALAEDLGRFLRGEPILARPVSRLERTIRWCRRQPVLAGSIATAMLFLIAATIVGGYHVAFRSEAGERTRRLTQDLSDKERLVQSAESKASQEQQRADSESRAKQRQICANKLSRSLDLCSAGDIDHGLLLMADALENAEQAEATELDRVLRLNIAAWSPRLATLEHVFRQENLGISHGEFSRDGQRLLTSDIMFHKVWDLASESVVVRPVHEQLMIWGAGWGPDEKTIFSAAGNGLRSWDALTGGLGWDQPLADSTIGNIDVAYSQDRRRILTWSASGTTGELWNAESGVRLAVLPHGDRIISAAFSPDGKTVATGSVKSSVKFWDANTGTPLPAKLSDEIPFAAFLRFTNDGQKILVCSRTANLFDIATGKAVGKSIDCGNLTLMPVGGYGFAMSSDGRTLALRAGGNGMRLFDLGTGEPLATLAHGGALYRVVFDQADRRLATTSVDGTARLWDARTGAQLSQPLRHGSSAVQAVGFSAVAPLLFTGDESGTTRVWRDPGVIRPKEGRLAGYSSVFGNTILTDSGRVVIGQWKGQRYTIGTWNALTGQSISSFLLNEQPVKGTWSTNLAVSRDGRQAAVVWYDSAQRNVNYIRRIKLPTGEEMGEPIALERSKYTSIGLEYSPAGDSLLIHSTWRAAVVDANRGVLEPIKMPSRAVPRKFSPDGKLVLCTSGAGTMELRSWPPTPSGELGLIGNPSPHGGAATFCFSGDSTTLAGLSASGIVQTWSTTTLQPVGPSIQLPAGGQEIAMNRTGDLLAVSDSRGEIGVWNPQTGYAIGPRYGTAQLRNARAIRFSDDDRWLIGCYSDGAVRQWPVPKPLTAPAASIKPALVVRTGTELREDGSLLVLNAKTWMTRRKALAGTKDESVGDIFAEDPPLKSPEPHASLARIPEWQSDDVWEGKVLAPDLSGSKPLHADEFDDPASGFRVAENAKYKSASFYRDGRFVIRSEQKNRCVRSSPWTVQDFACRVQGRSVGSGQSYWELHVTPGVTGQFLQVRLIADGSVQVRLSHTSNEHMTIGPLFHPAIKRGEAFNELLVILHDNELQIYVNGAAIADSIRPSFTIPAGRIMLTGGTDSSGQSEFERIEVWGADAIAPRGKP